MLTKPQNTVQDWIDLHRLTSQEVLNYCDVIRQRFQSQRHDASRNGSKSLSFDIEQSLEHLVLPALGDLLSVASSEKHNLSAVKIIKHEAGGLDLPFTEWDTKTNAPASHMVWSGTADDLMCLAHEMAHAAQMILSKGAFMPPVAREACAFLGELALIRYAKMNSRALCRELQSVWHRENKCHLADDIVQSANDLKAGSAPYHYRYNYPLARIAAIALFAAHGSDAIKKSLLVARTRWKPSSFKMLSRVCGNPIPSLSTHPTCLKRRRISWCLG